MANIAQTVNVLHAILRGVETRTVDGTELPLVSASGLEIDLPAHSYVTVSLGLR